nr:MAG TPA: hypothetical protein [Caudoviricetes sp.]
MITLNNINLSSIDLSGIDLRGIKLGLGGRGGGSGDGFPQLPGDVTRWHFGGLTNEMMAAMDDPRIEDADGKGRFLSFKNFAWGGMSGVNGYVQNFNNFKNNATVDKVRIDEQSSNSIKVTILTTGISNAIYIPKNIYQFNKSYSIKISSEGYNEGDLSLSFYASSVSTATTVKVPLNPNGITEIPAIKEDDFLAVYLNVGGKVGSITIEQLPLYPGFILGDGVDDFAVTEKELNFEDTYTVYTAFIPFQNNPTRNMILCGADSKKTFSMQYSSLVYVSFIADNNYYINADFVNGLNLFACKRNGNNICIKNLLTNKVVTGTCGDWVENAGLYYLWKNATYASFARAGIAGQIIDNGHFTTDKEDENILDWHKKQYPWLFPGQAWTVTGKTNEDEDRTTIANITGNGNNLVLSNFGFIEGSGYNKEGEYAGYLVTDGVDDMIGSSIFEIGKDFTIIDEWKFMDNIIANAGISKALSLFVYNTNNGLRIFINNTTKGPVLNTKTLKAICSDGRVYSDDWSEMIVNEEQPITSSKSSLLIGINGNNFAKIALKNLAIYNQILSKDDCIKAYNYLQTLKAK